MSRISDRSTQGTKALGVSLPSFQAALADVRWPRVILRACSNSFMVIVFCAVMASPADAQLGVEWVELKQDATRLALPSEDLVSNDSQVIFAVGDLDQDGWLDVVGVRKQRGSQLGGRANVLLMNEAGVLVDRTSVYATASDVQGDQGFLTATNDRDLVITDVDGDGWDDLATATTLSDGLPKTLSHPRIYRNLGNATGSWQGFKHEDARIPQLFTVGGLAVAPRFCDVAAGDLDGDDSPDLHFVDYDVPPATFIQEPAAWDMNDRVLINDGFGFFSDQSANLLSVAQLNSDFGIDNRIIDMNGDGTNDIVKLNALGFPYQAIIHYNYPQGSFSTLGTQLAGGGSPYGMNVGDLNNDGRLDLVLQNDTKDRYRLNMGNDVFGMVVWGGIKLFGFAGGADDGLGHRVLLHDLNHDGWNDVFICDFDIDLFSCTRRLHVYHNLGGVPGGDVDLVEEAELNSGDKGPGWKGVVGMSADQMAGTMDLAFGDYDHDGDDDVLQSNCAGVFYWENQTLVCQDDVGHGGTEGASLSICGDDLTKASSQATLRIESSLASAPVLIAVGLQSNPIPFLTGALVPIPVGLVIDGLSTDVQGNLTLPVSGGSSLPVTVFAQAIVVGGAQGHLTNALRIEIGQ